MGVNRVAPIITGQSTAQTINGSLKFESGKYLSRTFSTGNANTWTWSGWIKRGNLSTTQYPFRTPSVDEGFYFSTSDKIDVYRYTGSFTYFGTTPAVFRDNGGWYHVVYVHDSTQPTGSRLRFYINGVLQGPLTSFTDIASSTGYSLNSAVAHRLGEIDGYMSNVTFIDGQALGPGFFGFTDPLTGTWRPKRLKDGAPTANDGRTWSGDLTATSPGGYFNVSYPATNAFNGNLASSAVAEPNDGEITWAPSGGIQVNATIEIYRVSNPGTSFTASVNGGSSVNFKDGQWVDLGFSGNLRTLVITASGSQNPQISGIRVDGVVLVDATTTNVDFGTNGFYLPLDDQDDYTTDKSGKGNDWTANGFTGTSSNPDVVPDSPSGVVGSTKPTSGITTTSSITKPTNYATWNPLNNGHATAGGMTLSNGNLDASNGSTQRHIAANMAFPFPLRGKFYFEMTPGTQLASPVTGNVGFGDYNMGNTGATNSYQNFYTRSGAFYIQGSGFVVNDPTYAFGDGDTIGCAIDFDSNIVKWYRNGSLQQSLSFPAPTIAVWPHYVSYNSPVSANFGQRPFKHQPPDGYLTLCSANLRPSTVVTRPDQYVGIVTYTGNGSDGHSITGFGFSPDLLLVKARNQTYDWMMTDRCQGKSINHRTNSANRPSVDATNVTSLDSDGFTTSSGSGYMNGNNVPFVAYAWKAGGGNENGGEIWVDDVKYDSAAAAGLDGGTLTPNHASVNTKAGFSIINFIAGASSGDYTISHGMGKVPKFIILRDRNRDIGFRIYHASLDTSNPPKKYLQFTSAIAQTNTNNLWGAAGAISDTTFGITTQEVLFNSANTIAYLWADVPGLQKFGSYAGNGNANGPFVELGFRPKIILTKCFDNINNTDWMLFDAERPNYNPTIGDLRPNLNNIESSTNFDILSNGFKLRNGTGSQNYSGRTYIYCAWAEAPSFNLYGGQSLAR